MRYLGAILIFAAVFAAPAAAGRNTLAGTAIVGTAAAVGAGLATLYVLRRKETIPASWSLPTLGGFLFLALLSIVTSESVGASLLQVQVFFIYAFIFFGLLLILRDRNMRTVLLIVLVGSGAVLGGMGVREYTAYSYGPTWRVFGTFINPGYFGGFLAVVIPLTLGLYLATRQTIVTIAAAGALMLESASILLTGTRFAVFSAFAAVLLFVVSASAVKILDRRQWGRIAVALILIAPVAVGASKPLRSRAQPGTGHAHSGSFREVTWKATARMAESRPLLGVGPGAFQIAFPRFALAGYTRNAHQGYLQTASECGFPAAALLLTTLALAFFGPAAAVLRRKRESIPKGKTDAGSGERVRWEDVVPASTERLIVLAALGAMAGFFCRNLLDSDMYVVGVAAPFWASAALAVSYPEVGRRRWRISAWTAAAVIGLAVVVTGSLAVFAAADARISKADESVAEGYTWAAEEAAEGAARLNPWNADYRFKLSRILAVDPSTLPQAYVQMRKAISLEPTRAKYRYNLGHLFLANGKPRQALDAYSQALRLDPHSPNLMLAIAGTYDMLGEHAEALRMYRRLAALENTPYATLTGVPEMVEPSYAFAHFALGNEKLKRDPKAALDDYLKVIKRLDDRKKNSVYIDAMVAAGAADPEDQERITELRRETYVRMAQAYDELGRKNQAQKYRKLADEAQ